MTKQNASTLVASQGQSCLFRYVPSPNGNYVQDKLWVLKTMVLLHMGMHYATQRRHSPSINVGSGWWEGIYHSGALIHPGRLRVIVLCPPSNVPVKELVMMSAVTILHAA